MSNVASATPGAATKSAGHALFVFHAALFVWWAFGQAYYRVAPRFFVTDPTFPFGVVSLGFIAVSLFVTLRFAVTRRGTAAESVTRLAMAFAVIDLVGESLQFAPQLGLPALLPSDRSTTELWLRGSWVSCEFGLRSAMFVALWRTQTGADRRLPLLFACLVGLQWLLALLTFARFSEPYAVWWSAHGSLASVLRVTPWLSFTWLPILIGLSRRVARA